MKALGLWLGVLGAALVAGIVLSPINGIVIVIMTAAAWFVDLMMRRLVHLVWWKRAPLAVGGALALLQLIPYGRAHENPAITQEPIWDSAETRALAMGACYDCHSNETMWPWYAAIAPTSWITQHHVEEGRQKLNFSEWDRAQDHAGEAADAVRKGEMPLLDYLIVHPRARLTDAEKASLIAGLEASFGDGGGHDHDDDGDH